MGPPKVRAAGVVMLLAADKEAAIGAVGSSGQGLASRRLGLRQRQRSERKHNGQRGAAGGLCARDGWKLRA